MPTNNFYVAESLTVSGHYVSGLDQNQEPTWSSDIDDAEWSYSQTTVDTYINRFSINAKPKETGGVHPPKPPLP